MGSAVPPPYQGSLAHLEFLLPAEREVRRRGARDPAFRARKAKKKKAEVVGVTGSSGYQLSPTMQTPADVPRVETDSGFCPRKVRRWVICLHKCLSS